MNAFRTACVSVLVGMLGGLAVAAEGPVAADGLPPHASSDASVKYDYPIVYVRVARPYPKEYAGINHLNQAGLHQTNAPGAELRLLHPDGKDECLVAVQPTESITDPAVSFDAKWVYFAKFHDMRKGSAHMSNLRSRQGADIYKINIATREVMQLTRQERTPNYGAIPEGVDSHPRGVHNLGPCPVPGGRVVFVSDRNGYRGVREQTQPALQLYVMDDHGRNVELIGALNLGTALHPVALKDGRIMFSSLETQGLRSDERWGIWAIHPDGTNWKPLTSALGSPPGQAVHFQAQLSDESIVVESYYQTGSTDGFGTFWKFPMHHAPDTPAFLGANKEFMPIGMMELTKFASNQDIRPNRSGDVSNRDVSGTVTHPSGAPEGALLCVWSLPQDLQDASTPQYDAGIYLMKPAGPVASPAKMLRIKNDPGYQELWPRALVPYRRIYGVDEPPKLSHRNDGKQSPHLPEGTPFGLVGTSSLYKRETYPNGVVPKGSVTAVSQKPADRKLMWRELMNSRFGHPGNWGEQGADAGLYENGDIWGIRILVLEPMSDAISEKNRPFFALGSSAEERIRILGEFPVRKFNAKGEPSAAKGEPVDPDGNPDTSFLAKVPADVAWTFQTIDNNGMAVNMAQTWHQVRPGEVRNNCGGCHAHSQAPTDFKLTAAAKPDYKVWDLTTTTPLFTTKAGDTSKQKWDAQEKTGLRTADAAVQDVEFYRDVKPILDVHCVACHSKDSAKPAGKLALDDYSPITRDWRVPWAENITIRSRDKVPHTYARLAQYSWAFQARRSPLIWKIYGQRLDGFHNDDVPSPELDYHNNDDVLGWCHRSGNKKTDVDFTGKAMPPPEAAAGKFESPDGKPVRVPPLSDEQKLTMVRWVDLGCPIDLEPARKNADGRPRGWMLDEGKPTLTLAYPQAGVQSGLLTRIVVGMHDYMTGLDMQSFTVTASVAVDGVAAGENLGGRFERTADGVWELKLKQPLKSVGDGKLVVSVKDKQGNMNRIERSFRIE